MDKPRKSALRFLWALLSVSILFNSPAGAELVLCVGPACESCIELALLHPAGESLRPASGPERSHAGLRAASASGGGRHPPVTRTRLASRSPPRFDPSRVHLRTVRLLI